MHTAAVLVGILLTLVCGIALKMALSMLLNLLRVLDAHGVRDSEFRLPRNVAAIVVGHALGVIAGLTLIVWGVIG